MPNQFFPLVDNNLDGGGDKGIQMNGNSLSLFICWWKWKRKKNIYSVNDMLMNVVRGKGI